MCCGRGGGGGGMGKECENDRDCIRALEGRREEGRKANLLKMVCSHWESTKVITDKGVRGEFGKS